MEVAQVLHSCVRVPRRLLQSALMCKLAGITDDMGREVRTGRMFRYLSRKINGWAHRDMTPALAWPAQPWAAAGWLLDTKQTGRTPLDRRELAMKALGYKGSSRKFLEEGQFPFLVEFAEHLIPWNWDCPACEAELKARIADIQGEDDAA